MVSTVSTFCGSSTSMRRTSEAGTTVGRLDRVKGQMGVRMNASISGWRMGPPAAMEYAVEPVGVATMTPSARYRPRYWSEKKIFSLIMRDIPSDPNDGLIEPEECAYLLPAPHHGDGQHDPFTHGQVPVQVFLPRVHQLAARDFRDESEIPHVDGENGDLAAPRARLRQHAGAGQERAVPAKGDGEVHVGQRFLVRAVGVVDEDSLGSPGAGEVLNDAHDALHVVLL